MFFASDNAGPAHPKVIEALATANDGYAKGYGAEAAMAEVTARVRDLFEAPEAQVFLVVSGTAANSLCLSTMAKPWDTIFCSTVAHIHEDECNAPEFYTGGAKLTLVPGEDGKIAPDALRKAILGEETRGVHGPQRGPLSLTQATERGAIYTCAEIAELTGLARGFGMRTHLDGARFANALVRLGCSPAEMTWKAGVDAVSFGGTKNGLIGVEAAILFDPADSWEFELRRKRGAHLLSKHRYLSAQMQAYLTDGLWLEMAKMANDRSDRLLAGLRASAEVEIIGEPRANMIFFSAARQLHQRLHDGGAVYYLYGGDLDGSNPEEALTGRLVCDWSMTEEAVDAFLALLDS